MEASWAAVVGSAESRAEASLAAMLEGLEGSGAAQVGWEKMEGLVANEAFAR